MSFFDLKVLWEKLAPILGLLFFLFKILVYFGGKKIDPQQSTKSKTRGQRGSYNPPRWSTPSRTRFSKRWSVNDIPRP